MNNDTIFCKTSKSSASIARNCIEPYFVSYQIGKYSYSQDANKKLSFVPIETAILTLAYGDTLSIFKVDKNELNNAYYIGGALKEWEIDRLFTKQQYLLNNVDVICNIIKQSNHLALSQCLNMNCGANSLYVKHFSNLNFVEVSDFWKNVLYYYNNAPGSYDEKVLQIHANPERFYPWLEQERFVYHDIEYNIDNDLEAEEIELD